MTIILSDKSVVARTILHGADTQTVPDGRRLKIDIPSVASVFDGGPPAGKQWRVVIDLTIEETDA